MKKITFRSSGGFGKQIMAVGVVKMLRHKYPDAIIHVQTSYPEAFTNLDFIEKFYPLNNVPYFYEEHKDFEVFECEAYLSLGFRQNKMHLIEAWCERLGLDSPSSVQGIINLDYEEIEVGKQWKMQVKIDKPLIAFQPFGGTSYYNPEEANNILRATHSRSLKFELAQEIANGLIEKGFAVMQIGLPTEKQLDGCLKLPQNIYKQPRLVISLINQCEFAIGIDSFLQHAWTALNKKEMLVMWGGTHPKTLGYETNINISRKEDKICNDLFCNRPNTFLFDYRGNGSPWKCPKNSRCMKFDAKKVLDIFDTKVLKKEIPVPTPMKSVNMKPKVTKKTKK